MVLVQVLGIAARQVLRLVTATPVRAAAVGSVVGTAAGVGGFTALGPQQSAKVVSGLRDNPITAIPANIGFGAGNVIRGAGSTASAFANVAQGGAIDLGKLENFTRRFSEGGIVGGLASTILPTTTRGDVPASGETREAPTTRIPLSLPSSDDPASSGGPTVISTGISPVVLIFGAAIVGGAFLLSKRK